MYPDRRDLFRLVAGAAASAGIIGTVSTAEAVPIPALIVLEVPGPITQEAAARIVASLEQRLTGTPFEGVKTVVLTNGITLTLLDAQGRVITQRLGADQ